MIEKYSPIDVLEIVKSRHADDDLLTVAMDSNNKDFISIFLKVEESSSDPTNTDRFDKLIDLTNRSEKGQRTASALRLLEKFSDEKVKQELLEKLSDDSYEFEEDEAVDIALGISEIIHKSTSAATGPTTSEQMVEALEQMRNSLSQIQKQADDTTNALSSVEKGVNEAVSTSSAALSMAGGQAMGDVKVQLDQFNRAFESFARGLKLDEYENQPLETRLDNAVDLALVLFTEPKLQQYSELYFRSLRATYETHQIDYFKSIFEKTNKLIPVIEAENWNGKPEEMLRIGVEGLDSAEMHHMWNYGTAFTLKFRGGSEITIRPTVSEFERFNRCELPGLELVDLEFDKAKELLREYAPAIKNKYGVEDPLRVYGKYRRIKEQRRDMSYSRYSEMLKHFLHFSQADVYGRSKVVGEDGLSKKFKDNLSNEEFQSLVDYKFFDRLMPEDSNLRPLNNSEKSEVNNILTKLSDGEDPTISGDVLSHINDAFLFDKFRYFIRSGERMSPEEIRFVNEVLRMEVSTSGQYDMLVQPDGTCRLLERDQSILSERTPMLLNFLSEEEDIAKAQSDHTYRQVFPPEADPYTAGEFNNYRRTFTQYDRDYLKNNGIEFLYKRYLKAKIERMGYRIEDLVEVGLPRSEIDGQERRIVFTSRGAGVVDATELGLMGDGQPARVDKDKGKFCVIYEAVTGRNGAVLSDENGPLKRVERRPVSELSELRRSVLNQDGNLEAVDKVFRPKIDSNGKMVIGEDGKLVLEEVTEMPFYKLQNGIDESKTLDQHDDIRDLFAPSPTNQRNQNGVESGFSYNLINHVQARDHQGNLLVDDQYRPILQPRCVVREGTEDVVDFYGNPIYETGGNYQPRKDDKGNVETARQNELVIDSVLSRFVGEVSKVARIYNYQTDDVIEWNPLGVGDTLLKPMEAKKLTRTFTDKYSVAAHPAFTQYYGKVLPQFRYRKTEGLVVKASKGKVRQVALRHRNPHSIPDKDVFLGPVSWQNQNQSDEFERLVLQPGFSFQDTKGQVNHFITHTTKLLEIIWDEQGLSDVETVQNESLAQAASQIGSVDLLEVNQNTVLIKSAEDYSAESGVGIEKAKDKIRQLKIVASNLVVNHPMLAGFKNDLENEISTLADKLEKSPKRVTGRPLSAAESRRRFSTEKKWKIFQGSSYVDYLRSMDQKFENYPNWMLEGGLGTYYALGTNTPDMFHHIGARNGPFDQARYGVVQDEILGEIVPALIESGSQSLNPHFYKAIGVTPPIAALQEEGQKLAERKALRKRPDISTGLKYLEENTRPLYELAKRLVAIHGHKKGKELLRDRVVEHVWDILPLPKSMPVFMDELGQDIPLYADESVVSPIPQEATTKKLSLGNIDVDGWGHPRDIIFRQLLSSYGLAEVVFDHNGNNVIVQPTLMEPAIEMHHEMNGRKYSPRRVNVNRYGEFGHRDLRYFESAATSLQNVIALGKVFTDHLMDQLKMDYTDKNEILDHILAPLEGTNVMPKKLTDEQIQKIIDDTIKNFET